MTLKMTLTVGEEDWERIKKLARDSEAESEAEVLRQALRLYEFFLKEELEGAKFVIQRSGKPPAPLEIFGGPRPRLRLVTD